MKQSQVIVLQLLPLFLTSHSKSYPLFGGTFASFKPGENLKDITAKEEKNINS